FAGNKHRANQQTITVLKDKGIDLIHQSQPVTARLLNWADIVQTMTIKDKKYNILQYPNFSDKHFTLKEYVSEADKEVWTERKKVYANYEEKRFKFIQENQHKFDNTILDQKLAEHLQSDIDKIQRMERSLISYDISDPFGGELNVYQKTLSEIDHYINMLVEKLNKSKEEIRTGGRLVKKSYRFSLRMKLVLFTTVLALITYSTSAFFIYYLYDELQGLLHMSMEMFAMITLILGIIWSGILAYLFARIITKPLENLENVASQAAEGDLNQTVDIQNSDDEI